jgi:hypothetical protein
MWIQIRIRIRNTVFSYSEHLHMSPRQSSNFSLLLLGEQHGAPDVGAAEGPGSRPGEGDDGQDGHLVPLRQPDGAPHREQGRGDPHILALQVMLTKMKSCRVLTFVRKL